MPAMTNPGTPPASRKRSNKKELVYKHKKSPYYQMDFQVGGMRISGSTECTNKREAMAHAQKVRKRVEREQEERGVGPRRKLVDMRLVDAIRSYDEAGRLPRKKYPIVDRITEALGDAILLSEIDDAAVSGLVVALGRETSRVKGQERRKLASPTVNNHLILLRTIMRFAARNAKIPLPDMPQWGDHFLDAGPRRREMTVAEEMRLEAACRPDFLPLVRFTLLTGLRRASALIRWSQVDFAQNVIRVVVKGRKGNKEREVPITPDVLQILLAQRGKNDEFVFTFKCMVDVTARGVRYLAGNLYPIHYRQFAALWAQACKAANVADLHIHDLRKTFGARMVRVAGIAKASKALHHASITTTERSYSHITAEDIAQGIRDVAAAHVIWRAREMDARRGTPIQATLRAMVTWQWQAPLLAHGRI